MTLIEALNLFHAYRASKSYIQYETFVESLSRPENNNVIIPITEGIGVIIEGLFLNNYTSGSFKKYLTVPSKELLTELLKNKNYDEIRNYMFGIMIQLVDRQYPMENQQDLAEGLYTKAIELLSGKPDIIEKYNPAYALTTYVNNFIMKPARTMFNWSSGKRLEQTDLHVDAKVSYNEENQKKIKPDQSNTFGKIINDTIVDGKIEVRWEGTRGKNGQYDVKPYTEMVPVDELDINDVKTGIDTVSDNTALANKPNMDDDLTLHGVLADKSSENQKLGDEISEDIKETINEVIEDAQDETDLFDAKSIRKIEPLIKKQIEAQSVAKSLYTLKEKKRQQETNIKNREHTDTYQKQIDELNSAIATQELVANNSYGTKTFGSDFGLSREQSEWAWKKFIELMKTMPGVEKWFGENKGIQRGVNPDKVQKTPEGNFIMSEKEIRKQQQLNASRKLQEKKRLAKQKAEAEVPNQ